MIRSATRDDIPALAEIYCRSWEFAYRGIIADDFLDSITVAGRITRFNGMESIPEYVYVYDSKVIGCSRLIESRDYDVKNCAEIQTIYFLPEYIGRGHGRNFLNWLIQSIAGVQLNRE